MTTSTTATDSAAKLPPLDETRVIALVGAVQFVNVLDFMMVMPMGPDFSRALSIPLSSIGAIGASYGAAASIAGLVGALFLDRFDRRTALGVALLGLVAGTILGGFATGFGSLVAARLVAGAFGGPATSLSVAVVADVVPPERRGVAMSKVMGAFSVASVLGVPLGLELARLFGFRTPFFAIGGLGLLVALGVLVALPPLRMHLGEQARAVSRTPFFEPTIVLSLVSTACIMGGNFALIPNLSSYVQQNLGYPRAHMGFLYFFGGIAAFVTMRLVGPLVDRRGSAPIIGLGTLLYALVVLSAFVLPIPGYPPVLAYVAFMSANSVRFVPNQALQSRVPTVDRRARFLSAQSAVQHLASATGAYAASLFLSEGPDHRLVGLEHVALGAVLLSLVVPAIAVVVERQVRERERARMEVR